LGIGSGWFERDYEEYGFPFGTARQRLADLERDLPIIKERLAQLTPGPVGDMPILIGGSGEKVTLRLVAQYADAWNTFGPPDNFAAKNRVLNEWCEREGRNPADIERTVGISVDEVDQLEAYAEAGADHVIFMVGAPFDLDPVAQALDAR
jgi:alkanesulfonate monooxygenase SsuD/methylene tetrahydromethanopterin reductase-like flavin-dependent oxidoreductase (luciferase family)